VQLPFESFAVRDMKSRWGSCSSQKKITLCVNLVFLPTYLIDHVLLHELCHIKYMSHGKRFWSLLERFDQNAKKNNNELKRAAECIPRWLFYRY
jgi:predicted metal-dependent hydrolase